MQWTERVLAELNPDFASLYLVADPDGLLNEPHILQAIHARGFELLPYEDPVAFRYAYEQRVRGRRDHAPVIVVVAGEHASVRHLPYDLIRSGKTVAFSLADLFPDINHAILKTLAPEDLTALSEALEIYAPGKLGDNAGKDFVLRHVFLIAPELIKQPADLLRMLLRKHYRDIKTPPLLDERLIRLLERHGQFRNWPLPKIVRDREQFFGFLQRHWPRYIQAVLDALAKGVKEPAASYDIDAIVLPFGHDDVRVYIDNLFLEGFLQPIEIERPDLLAKHWSIVGIRRDPKTQLRKRAQGLLELCQQDLPEHSTRHQSWLQFAHRWAELTALHHRHRPPIDEKAFTALRQELDQRFAHWLLERFGSLYTHPPSPPVMLHHIPREMARHLERGAAARVALVLVDGLALDQWVTLRAVLNRQLHHRVIQEAAVFAWVPTITTVSRQALFAAKAPFYFAKSIHTTAGEEKAWRRFWRDQGLDPLTVYYAKGLGSGEIHTLAEPLSDHRLKAAGLIIHTVDTIMHGMQLGSAGMHNQLEQWAEQGYLSALLDTLSNLGYRIYLTADHGNIEATGLGRIGDGATADARGERVRVYSTERLRQRRHAETQDTIPWPPYGLPDNYFALLAADRKAFIGKSGKVVAHGGITLEEVIVPYIQIERGSE